MLLLLAWSVRGYMLTPGIADHQAVAQGILLMPALRARSCSAHWT